MSRALAPVDLTGTLSRLTSTPFAVSRDDVIAAYHAASDLIAAARRIAYRNVPSIDPDDVVALRDALVRIGKKRDFKHRRGRK